MALTEIQWGRILALAWLEEGFKNAFECDPADALRKLRDPNSDLRKGLKDPNLISDDLLEDLGIDGETALVDLERIVDYPVDFAGAPKEVLDKIKNGNLPLEMPPEYYYWGLNSKTQATTVDDTTLSLKEWAQIYACIWLDEKPENTQKKGYKARFERDPVQVVKEIMQYPSDKVFRLFVISKKLDWMETQLREVIKTGELGGYPLVWIITKCC